MSFTTSQRHSSPRQAARPSRPGGQSSQSYLPTAPPEQGSPRVFTHDPGKPEDGAGGRLLAVCRSLQSISWTTRSHPLGGSGQHHFRGGQGSGRGRDNDTAMTKAKPLASEGWGCSLGSATSSHLTSDQFLLLSKLWFPSTVKWE